jgi:SnoaL-like domain
MPSMDAHELEAEVQELRARVQELQDRWEIAELKARYFRIVDEKDWDAWRGLFTDDATFDLGDGRLREGADAFVDGVHGMLDGAPGRAVSVHRGHMPELTIDSPTEAHGRWGLADYIEWPADPESGERRGYRGYGHELETYRKVDGVWKIATWRLVYIRMDPLPRQPLPDSILGGPDVLREDEYIDEVTAEQ